jgi:hypothetical protein
VLSLGLPKECSTSQESRQLSIWFASATSAVSFLTGWWYRLTATAQGRSVAQAVSRRTLTVEARVRSWSLRVGFFVDKVALGQVFSPSTSVFPCQFHSTSAPLHGKNEKINHLHHRVAQEALTLRCVRSTCCGALHHKTSCILDSTQTSRTLLPPSWCYNVGHTVFMVGSRTERQTMRQASKVPYSVWQ